MKAIIYYRKSTDRDDRQANSLEHQLTNCRKTAQANNLDVIKEIGESRSAKTEFKRDWFNEMIRLCKRWKVDYLICDEPKRLSRNNIDTSRLVDLLDKKQIKAILATSREYHWDNSRDKFLLQLDLSLSKMDNEDRGKDTKDKMETCMKNTGRFLAKAPFWYRNITVKKWHKSIIIDKQEAKLIKEIFELRIGWKAFSTIARLLKEKYAKTIKFNYSANRIHRLVGMKFYHGIFTWNGKDVIGSHKPIITQEMYEKANKIWKWVHEKTQTIQKRKPWKYYLKGFVKDISWLQLTSYVQKGITYYSHQYKSKHKVSINENLLFEKVWTLLKDIDLELESPLEAHRTMIIDLIEQYKVNNSDELKAIEKQIDSLENKKDKLLDMKLDNIINEETYLTKHNQFENAIKALMEQKEKIKKDDFEQKTQIMLELAGSYYRSYFRANMEWKTYIIKNLMLELFVGTKKELQIEESPLLRSSKFLKILYGSPNSSNIRTFKRQLSMIDFKKLKKFHKFIKNLQQ